MTEGEMQTILNSLEGFRRQFSAFVDLVTFYLEAEQRRAREAALAEVLK